MTGVAPRGSQRTPLSHLVTPQHTLTTLMKKLSFLLLTPLLVSCGGPSMTETYDIVELRVQCEKESGFSGASQLVPETKTAFVWRADGENVAECQDGKLVEIF